MIVEGFTQDTIRVMRRRSRSYADLDKLNPRMFTEDRADGAFVRVDVLNAEVLAHLYCSTVRRETWWVEVHFVKPCSATAPEGEGSHSRPRRPWLYWADPATMGTACPTCGDAYGIDVCEPLSDGLNVPHVLRQGLADRLEEEDGLCTEIAISDFADTFPQLLTVLRDGVRLRRSRSEATWPKESNSHGRIVV